MMRGIWTLVAGALFLSGSMEAVMAADAPHVEITPYVGYRMGGEFDVNDDTAGEDRSVDVEDAASWGVDVGIYRDRNSFYELLYSQQSASLDTSDPALRGVDVKTEYFHLGGTLLYPDDQWFVPFLSLTVGATRFDAQGGGYGSETNFSASLGGGMRIPVGTNFDVTLGLRGYLTFVDSDTEIFCVGSGSVNCLLRTSGSTYFQGEALVGFTAKF
jgi:hypothetical protein